MRPTNRNSRSSGSSNDSSIDDNGDQICELQQVTSEAPGMPATIETSADIPPDGGYGWVCVACATMINSCTWGINSSYGVYLAHYLADNSFPGATPMQYAFIGGLAISSSMIAAPLVTLLLRKTSTRKTMAVGVVLQTFGLLAASFATKVWHLFLTQGILFGVGLGFLFTSSVGVVSQWFLKKRSVATGIAVAGSGLGGLIFSLGTRAIITNLGTEWSFRILAAVTCAVNTLCTFLTRDRNKQVNPNQRAFDLGLLQRYEFLLVLSWVFFSILGYVVLLFSLPDFAAARGFTKMQGSVLSALLNLGMAFGRPLVGLASDWYGRINIAGLMTIFTWLTCLVLWLPATQFGLSAFFALTNGAICGTIWTTMAPLCAEVVGLVDLPSALSLVMLAMAIPAAFAEVIALYLRRPDLENQYLYPQIFTITMFLAASVSIWLLRGWSLGETDRRAREEEKPKKAEAELRETAGTGLLARWASHDVSRWLRYAHV